MSALCTGYNAWCEANGVRQFSSVAVATIAEPYGRGIVTLETVPAHKPVFTVPAALLMISAPAVPSSLSVVLTCRTISAASRNAFTIHHGKTEITLPAKRLAQASDGSKARQVDSGKL